jgi:xanthine dehydrogenase small subunit
MSAYHRPETLDEAIKIYAADPTLKVLAGGTDLYPETATRAGWGNMKRPGILDISRLEQLRGIVPNINAVSIGPLATWREIIDADLPPLYNGLKAAAREIGGQQVQNRGTIGGNLCNASPAADGVAVLMSLRAQIWSVSPYWPPATSDAPAEPMFPSTRYGVIASFLKGNRRTWLTKGEIVTGIIAGRSGRGYFRKLGARHSLVISIAIVAATFDWDERGNVKTARVVVGACSPVAQRLSALEDVLRGKPLDPALVKPEHLDQLTPIDDIRASAEYRRAAALQLVKDVIAEAAEDQGGGRV